MEKAFNVDEANALIPKIAGMFDEIFSLNKRINEISADIDNLMSIWGDDIFDPENADNADYEKKVKERREVIKNIQQKVEEINQTGAVVKDIEKGLVDFYHTVGNDLVLLCWMAGESKIEYWHQLDAGSPGRRPLSELQKIKPRVK